MPLACSLPRILIPHFIRYHWPQLCNPARATSLFEIVHHRLDALVRLWPFFHHERRIGTYDLAPKTGRAPRNVLVQRRGSTGM